MPEDFRGPQVAVITEDGQINYLESTPPRRRVHREEELVYMQVPLGALGGTLAQLSPTQLRIIDTILSDYRDKQPWARMTATELAVETGISVKNLYKAIAPLRRTNVVLRPSSTMWQVNPHVGWRGSRKSWMQAMSITPEPDMGALRG